jgi:hypothetical protein
VVFEKVFSQRTRRVVINLFRFGAGIVIYLLALCIIAFAIGMLFGFLVAGFNFVLSLF